MLAVGEGADRIWGLASVLFFGAGGVAYFGIPLLTRRGGEGIRHTSVEHRGVAQPGIVFTISRAKVRLGTVGCAAFTAAGLLFVLVGEKWVGFLTAGIFGVMTVIGATRAFGGPAYIAILREGILQRGTGSAFVPWEAIESVEIIEIRGTKMVGLRADPAAIETSYVLQLGIIAGRSIAGVEMSFSALVAEEEELCRAIEHFLRNPEARGRIGDGATLDLAVPR